MSSFLNAKDESTEPADSSFLSDALRDPTTRFIVFRGGEVLLATTHPIQPALLSALDLAELSVDLRTAILVGIYNNHEPRLALDIEQAAVDSLQSSDFSGDFHNLQAIQEPVESETWEMLSRAWALLAWNRDYATCPTCGGATEPQEGGTIRTCSNRTCGRIHYPRTDPTIIVRVISHEKCLLARQPQFRPGLKSVLAGFVEPGETLEGAVLREVQEEVGLAVDRIAYLGSQPWPFPMSLMIAFEAHALEETIQIDTRELEAADWYTRERVRQELAEGTLELPSLKSISRRMIDEWLEGRDNS